MYLTFSFAHCGACTILCVERVRPMQQEYPKWFTTQISKSPLRAGLGEDEWTRLTRDTSWRAQFSRAHGRLEQIH